MGGMPDWTHYESRYWSPDDEETYDVTMEYIGEELKKFDEHKPERWVMSFKVFRVDKKEFEPPKIFSTGAQSFAEKIRPIMEEKNIFTVFLTYRKKYKEYNIIPAKVISQALENGTKRH